MAKMCVLTGKHTVTGNNRSHSLVATRRKWHANLHKVTINVDGRSERVYMSARALRTLKKAA